MKRKSRPRCPYVDNPFEECYVTDLSSSAVEKAVTFCSGKFESCEIYIRRTSKENQRQRSAVPPAIPGHGQRKKLRRKTNSLTKKQTKTPI